MLQHQRQPVLAIPTTIRTERPRGISGERGRDSTPALWHHPHSNTTITVSTATMRDVPPMLFKLKNNVVSPVNARSGSSVPVIFPGK
jgi:hypothetical protein